MSFVKATLMSAREPPLGERGDPVHTREHDIGGLPTALDVDRLVDVAVSDGWRIAGPGVDPSSTFSVTKPSSEAADASASTAMRHRPNPRGSRSSTR
ncbi:hypothetical protein, partial [Ferrimicrobium acidiphilum]